MMSLLIVGDLRVCSAGLFSGYSEVSGLPLIPTGATQTFTGWFTVDSSTGLVTAGSLPDQLIQIPWGEIMNTKKICAGLGALALIGGLAACGSAASSSSVAAPVPTTAAPVTSSAITDTEPADAQACTTLRQAYATFEADQSTTNADALTAASVPNASMTQTLYNAFQALNGDLNDVQLGATDASSQADEQAVASGCAAAGVTFPASFTGSASATAPAAVATTPTPSPTITTTCIVPNVIGAGGAGSSTTAASVAPIINGAGLRAVEVLTKSDPTGSVPQGQLWGETPSAGSHVTCGSVVTVYFQPQS